MTANTPGLAAIVVSHQSIDTIDDCLTRLRNARGVTQIRVVDNGSVDGTLDVIQRHASVDPRLHFIGNPDNPGFGVACNDGARDSDADWLVFVNPDGLVEPDALARLLAHAEGVGRDALLGADLVDGQGVRDAAARRRDPDFLAMLTRPAARDLSIAADDALLLQPVDAVSGAVMLMPRRLFQAVGGFDPGYRLHAEDLDLCRRVRATGALVAVANDVRIVHVRGVSSRSRPLFVEWHKHRGLARYFGKFEAARRGVFARLGVYVAIWSRFPFAALRALAHP